MSEVQVRQGSEEWLELRRCVSVTASQFGEVLGVGKGRPYDFLLHLLSRNSKDANENQNQFTKHGLAWEPIINEAYQLLTGHVTKSSGFWLPEDGDPLKGLIGASPDAKVFTNGGEVWNGLVEYKAPFYKMYSPSQSAPHGIPRHYMAQMQGQMALCNKPWCDFMALCTRTKEIMLKRVYFQKHYWTAASAVLQDFSQVLEEAHNRQAKNLNPVDFLRGHRLKQWPTSRNPLPGERAIVVENLLETDARRRFRSKAGTWMTYGFLVGEDMTLSAELVEYSQKLMEDIDRVLEKQASPNSQTEASGTVESTKKTGV